MDKTNKTRLDEELVSRYLAQRDRAPKPRGRQYRHIEQGEEFLKQFDVGTIHDVLLGGQQRYDLKWYIDFLQSLLDAPFKEVSASVKLDAAREIRKIQIHAAVQTPDVDAYVKKQEEGVKDRKKGQGISPLSNLKAVS